MARMFESVDWVDTPIGVFDLRRRTVPTAEGSQQITEVLVNGELLMSSHTTASERALATNALAMHRGESDLTVLVGGLGLGYTADAALSDSRVSSVVVVDAIPVLFDWLHAGHFPLSEQLTTNRHFSTKIADVYGDLLGPPDTPYDVLLIDVDHAPKERLDESSAPFYTVAGQRRVAKHLAAGGVLAVWSAGDDAEFAAVLAEVYDTALVEHVTWQDPYLDEQTDTLFFARASI